MLATIRTDAIMDGHGITATSELELPIDDMIGLALRLDRELRGQQIEIMARMVEERRQERREKRRQKRRAAKPRG